MVTLAIHGGEPAVSDSLNQRVMKYPQFDDTVIRRTSNAIKNNDISFPVSGGETKTLERNIQDYLETRHALCTNNGTSALYSALFAIGDGLNPETALQGKEIICPTFEIWSAIAPIAAFGGTPVFCEVDPETMVIDLDDVREKLTDDTAGILLCHMWSETCDLSELKRIAQEADVPVVEDASHTWGCEYRGNKLGTIFDIGALSMQASKSLPAGEGGVLVTDDDRLYDRATVLGHYERIDDDHRFADYSLTGLGYKFRMSPLCAAVANAEIQRLPERVSREGELMAVFSDALSDVPHVEPIGSDVDGYEKAGHFGTAFKVDFSALDADPETVVEALSEEGLPVMREAGNGYSLHHLEPRFETSGKYWGEGQLPVSERVYDRLVRIPAFRRGTVDDINRYSEGIDKVMSYYS